jgi:large subunit ribosomal protein L16
MKFFPSQTKYKKYFRLHLKKGYAVKSNSLIFSHFGVRALQNSFLTSRHIETLLMFLRKKLKKQGKIWFRVFPHISVSKKPGEVRMGKGKGRHSYWASFVKRGQIIFEVVGLPSSERRRILLECSHKLPFKSRILLRKIL